MLKFGGFERVGYNHLFFYDGVNEMLPVGLWGGGVVGGTFKVFQS